MQLPVNSLAAKVAGEVEGATSCSDRGLDRVHVDVIQHGDVEGRYAEAHEGELDDGVSRRVEARATYGDGGPRSPLTGAPSP